MQNSDLDQARTFIASIEKNCIRDIQSSPRQNARVLVKKLLGDPAHLIPEMLQNAEDANATVLRIDVNQDRILIQNDGKKFNDDQIDKICSIGLSTKKSLGYIGMYGIGFKSVFAVSRAPEIYTGQYSFCFDDETVFVPHWIPPKDEFCEWNTTVVLPLKDEQAYSSLFQHILGLEEDNAKSMIFLRNIKTIRIKKEGKEDIFEKNEIELPGLDRLGSQFKFIEIKKNGNTVVVFCVYTLKDKIRPDLLKHVIQERQLMGIDENEEYELQLNISFEIGKDGHIVPSRKGLLYAFLPTKVKTSLAFDINADFLLNPSREALNRTDDKYNCWLISLAVRAIEEIISVYKKNAPEGFSTDIYDLLPRDDEARDAWIGEKVCCPIMNFLGEGEFFMADSAENSWLSRSEIVEASSEIRNLFPVFSEAGAPLGETEYYYISEKIKPENRNFLVKAFCLKKIDTEYLLESFSKANILRDKTDNWFFSLFSYLGKVYSKLDWRDSRNFPNKAMRCYLIPCNSGEVVKLTENKVYRLSRKLPEFIENKILELRSGIYDLLTEEVKENEELQNRQKLAKDFLWGLVSEATPKTIYEDIVMHEFNNIEDGEADEVTCRLLDSYIAYLKKENIKAEKIKLRVKGQRVYRLGSTLYLCNDYLRSETGEIGYDIERIVKECPDALFVTPEYLSTNENIREWREYFIFCGVKIFPTIKEKIVFSARTKEEFLNKFKEEFGSLIPILKGTGRQYTGRDWDFSKRINGYAYRLKDYTWEDDFVKILDERLQLQDTAFFIEFLKMLDANWDNIKKFASLQYIYTDMISSTQTVKDEILTEFSSLIRWLQEKKWLPAKMCSGKEIELILPSEAYLLSVDTAGVRNALYIDPDMVKNQELRRILKLRTTKVETENGSLEDLDYLIGLYGKWRNECAPLNRENEQLLGRLYKLASETIESEDRAGISETLTKFKDAIRMAYDASGNWNRISGIHYYYYDSSILEKLGEDVKREIFFIPGNITPANIKGLLAKLSLKDLSLETSRILPDEIPFKAAESDHFVDLANALFSFLYQDKREAELKEECSKIAAVSCRHTRYLTYALSRGNKAISGWIKTDGILMDGIFWFFGELRDLGVEVGRELCGELKFDKETKDFIEKVFARSENYVNRVLRDSGREYRILFNKREVEPQKKDGPAPIEEPPRESSAGGRISTLRAKELEKLYIKKIQQQEEKEGQKVRDVSLENKGYDIESFGPCGERYIEVKGISEVELTDNEYRVSKELKDKYWLYVVIKYEPFAYRRIQNPTELCTFEKVFVDFRWSAKDWDRYGEEITE